MVQPVRMMWPYHLLASLFVVVNIRFPARDAHTNARRYTLARSRYNVSSSLRDGAEGADHVVADTGERTVRKVIGCSLRFYRIIGARSASLAARHRSKCPGESAELKHSRLTRIDGGEVSVSHRSGWFPTRTPRSIFPSSRTHRGDVDISIAHSWRRRILRLVQSFLFTAIICT